MISRSLRASAYALLIATGCPLGAEADAASNPPASLKAMRAVFADAIGNSRQAAVIQMTHFPLQNDVYQQPKTLTPKQFRARFEQFSVAEFGGCLKTQPLAKASTDRLSLGSWLTECNGNIFYFAEFGDTWLFSGFENANE